MRRYWLPAPCRQRSPAQGLQAAVPGSSQQAAQKTARRCAGRIFQRVDAAGELRLPGLQNQRRHVQLRPGQVQRALARFHGSAVGIAVQYRYNSLGKVSERTDQLGFTETFRYDEEGNLSLHIDRDGRQLQRACNVFGQPVYEKASDAEGKHTNISTWHYDSLGRVTRAVCDGKSYEYIYDAYGNLKEKRSNGKRLVSYTHDRAGQITEIMDPAGVSTRYEYDILGRRSRIYNNDGLEVRYGYDALNRIRHIRYGNGVETAYTYDGDGNIRTLETKAGENVLLSFAYQYDGNGNRTAKTGMQAALGGITAGNNALDISYNYDVRGQLLEERRNGASVCYAYDKAGNRIRKTDVQGEIRYLYNAKNQLVEEESPADRKQFSYDRQGGIIEEKNAAGIRLFSYNSRHQQTRVETETGNVQENRYDAEGLRFELLENGRRTSFVYHNGELLQEEGREEQGTSYHLGAGMEAFRRGQELSYYHRDEQLSTALVTDGHRNVQNSYQYDAFGMSLGTTEKLNNRIRYTGQQYDDVTGQYYLRARYYNPVAGRFMQEDVYQGDGLNLYAYCGNNPVVYDDPSGYASTSTGKACPPQGKISESVDETSYGKSSSNCTELVPYYPANNGAESGTPSGFYQDANGRWHRPNGDFASNAEVGIASPAKTATGSHGNSLSDPRTNYGYVLVDKDTNEILKFGETLYPETRYSKSYLEQNNAVMKVLESGSKEYIHYWQYDMNKYFEYMYDEFPPLLKSKGW